jgi:hypothetical protein
LVYFAYRDKKLSVSLCRFSLHFSGITSGRRWLLASPRAPPPVKPSQKREQAERRFHVRRRSPAADSARRRLVNANYGTTSLPPVVLTEGGVVHRAS